MSPMKTNEIDASASSMIPDDVRNVARKLRDEIWSGVSSDHLIDIAGRIERAFMEDRASRSSPVPSVDVGGNRLPQLPASGAAAVWQPIETAPKADYQTILICDEDGTVGLGYWDQDDELGEAWKGNEDLSGWVINDGSGSGPQACEPSAWMPLPAPPASGDGPTALDAAARSSSTEAVEQKVERLRGDWPPIKKAIWRVLTEAQLNVGYHSAWKLTDAVYEAVNQAASDAVRAAARAALAPSLPGKEEGRG